MPSFKQQFGFTLVELMVSIAIVAIVSAVGVVVYSSAQKSGRVSKRVQDLKAIQAALEVYKLANGAYPTGGVAAGTPECAGTTLARLVPEFMPVVPADPLDAGNASGANCYHYMSNKTSPVGQSISTEYKIRTNPGLFSSGEMTSATFGQQTALLDPAKDGNANCIVEPGATYQGWAIYSGSAATCAY